jgi:hypothetical protein
VSSDPLRERHLPRDVELRVVHQTGRDPQRRRDEELGEPRGGVEARFDALARRFAKAASADRRSAHAPRLARVIRDRARFS